jgi:Putative auto-transporter adhesin, head GIN domain
MSNQGAPRSLRLGASRIGFLPLLLLLAFAGCGGGDRITETRDVAPYSRLEVDGVDVKVVPGDGREVRVYAGENVIDRVETASSGGVLEIGVRDRGIVIGSDPLGDARVEVQASALEGVDVEGSGDVVLEGLDAQALELDLRGAADLEATGSVERLEAWIQGAGDADLSQLDTGTAVVVAEGASDVELNVRDRLRVLVEGAGDVTYRGDPVVESDVHGAGDLRRVGP